MSLPPLPPGSPGMFALADASELAAVVERAGFREVETGALTVVYKTDTPEQFTEFAWSMAPAMIIELVRAQPPEVQKRVWNRVTETYQAFQQADGRVRTENQAIWVTSVR